MASSSQQRLDRTKAAEATRDGDEPRRDGLIAFLIHKNLPRPRGIERHDPVIVEVADQDKRSAAKSLGIPDWVGSPEIVLAAPVAEGQSN